MKKGFNQKKYLKKQKAEIIKRIKKFNNKLYLEFGGKLFDDLHASRVLPGFEPDCKIELLRSFKNDLEIIFVINANDIEKHKVRADHGITYDIEVIRLINELNDMKVSVNSVVITQYTGQISAHKFQKKLERNNIKTYIHTYTKGYPTDVALIVSDEGYGANPYIETSKPLVVVTAPGPNSGKLATCLSQLYHEYKRGTKAGYAKFETFPIWDIPLKHPINLAYESATADLNDVLMIDSFHLEAYGKSTVNYNRDIEVFPVLKSILETIMGKSIYNSPTDMGVNTIGSAIENEEICAEASKQEILRRYYKGLCDYKEGLVDDNVPKRIKMIMNELSIDESIRKVIEVAKQKTVKTGFPAFAVALNSKKIIVGRETELLTAPASCFLNAIKHYAKIGDEIHLLSKTVISPVIEMKKDMFGEKNAKLNLQDVIIGLSILKPTNPTVEMVLSKVPKLNGLDAHSSFMLSPTDQMILRSLGINFTSEPEYHLNNIYLEN